MKNKDFVNEILTTFPKIVLQFSFVQFTYISYFAPLEPSKYALSRYQTLDNLRFSDGFKNVWTTNKWQIIFLPFLKHF